MCTLTTFSLRSFGGALSRPVRESTSVTAAVPRTKAALEARCRGQRLCTATGKDQSVEFVHMRACIFTIFKVEIEIDIPHCAYMYVAREQGFDIDSIPPASVAESPSSPACTP